MSEKHEALRLADILRNMPLGECDEQAAAELLRQHAMIEELRGALRSVDSDLSRVLHELAGSASLCWSPKPEGVFDSSMAIGFVEDAISEIRQPIRAVLAKAEAQS